MEKTLSVEERVRRAEEIYARRKNGNISTSMPYTRVSLGEGKKTNPLKKMLIQICICTLIYTGFYVIKNGEYIFTSEVVEQINNVLAYDINIEKVSEDILQYINSIRNKDVIIPEENIGASIASPDETNKENQTTDITEHEQDAGTTSQENSGEDISHPEETLGVTDEAQYTDESNNTNELLTDAEYIKRNYSIIKPLEGTITSRFGTRNPTTPTVPTYHTGIDIAREVGTKIIAAMEGEVTLVSTEGDYRKSCDNKKWRCNNTICTL